MRSALLTVDWIDQKKTITTDLMRQQVRFHVTNPEMFDFETIATALKKAGYPHAKVLKNPGEEAF